MAHTFTLGGQRLGQSPEKESPLTIWDNLPKNGKVELPDELLSSLGDLKGDQIRALETFFSSDEQQKRRAHQAMKKDPYNSPKSPARRLPDYRSVQFPGMNQTALVAVDHEGNPLDDPSGINRILYPDFFQQIDQQRDGRVLLAGAEVTEQNISESSHATVHTLPAADAHTKQAA